LTSPATLAFSYLLPNPSNPKSTASGQRLSITMFVFAAAVFRSEVALLLGTTVLHQLIIPSLSLERVIFPFTASFLIALVTSVPIDSYFWQRPLWPELWGFYYNVVQGSSSNWGVSPWHYYFSSALPRLLLNPLTYTLLIPFSLYHPALHRSASRLVTPCLLFIAIYSLQPHKETRFIFYIVPPLTAAAALSANFFSTPNRLKKSPLSALLAAVLALSVLGSLAASTTMLGLSALNYPGGEALAHLRATVLSSPQDGGIVPVHADVLSCMTGVTLFGTSTAESISAAAEAALSASRARWAALGEGESHSSDTTGSGSSSGGSKTTDKIKMNTPNSNTSPDTPQTQSILALDKTESPLRLTQPSFWTQFTYLLLEDPSKPTGGQWETLAVVQSYAGIEVLRPGDHDHDANANEGIQTAEPPVIGLGKTVATWRRRVRALTGGWWIGPRMVDRIYILRRVDSRDGEEGAVGRGWAAVGVEAR
jgi:alpha-1,6-mannosyltransferase